MIAGIVQKMRQAAPDAAAIIRLSDGREIPAIFSSLDREPEYDETGVEIGRRGEVYCDVSAVTRNISIGDVIGVRHANDEENEFERVRVTGFRKIGGVVLVIQTGAPYGR